MKNSVILFSILFVALVGVLSLTNSLTATGDSAEAVAMQSASNAPLYTYAWPAETLVGTANDTFLVPATLNSLWSYNYTLDVAMVADTASFVAILQESNKAAGGNWYEVERDTVAALIGSTQVRFYGSDSPTTSATVVGWVHGRRQRLIFDIYAGTGDTLTVAPIVTLKKH